MILNIPIQSSKNGITFIEANALMESVGWGKPYYQTEERWRRIIAASSHIAYAKDNEKLICFGRILEDGMMCMFYDVCVHPDYQGQNIGTLMMNHLIDKVKGQQYASIGLFVWEGNPSAAEFYGKLEFKSAAAMELKKFMR